MDVKGEFKGIAQRNEILTQLNYGFLHRMVTLEDGFQKPKEKKKEKKKKKKKKKKRKKKRKM